SMDAITTDPILQAKYLSLEGPDQKALISMVEANVRAADKPTEAQKAAAITIIGGLRNGNPKAYDAADLSKFPPTLAAQISVAKDKFVRGIEMDSHLKS